MFKIKPNYPKEHQSKDIYIYKSTKKYVDVHTAFNLWIIKCEQIFVCNSMPPRQICTQRCFWFSLSNKLEFSSLRFSNSILYFHPTRSQKQTLLSTEKTKLRVTHSILQLLPYLYLSLLPFFFFGLKKSVSGQDNLFSYSYNHRLL